MTVQRPRRVNSRYLTFLLRHHPEEIGIELDQQGWTKIFRLIDLLRDNDCEVQLDELLELVTSDSKRRFTLSDDGECIRAAQGHSIDVDLGLTAKEPPAVLFHGTATRFVNGVLKDGLHPGSRQHVHLSLDQETALAVGARHGRPKVLSVDAGKMFVDGYEFWLSENGVWLTRFVPVAFLTVVDELP